MKYSQNKCIHQVFAEQVEKTPDAVAVVFENQQLTYRELNAKANQLAHYLQGMGVGSEVLVGLCVERSIEVIIGILGILKAGGAYVPLDPAYPQERLAFMLEDTNLKVLLTKTEWIEILPVTTASVILLDADWQKIEQHSQQNPVCDATPENLAYLIYTSGSTGKPKGVQMPHASICSYIKAIAKIILVNSNDIYLHTASFSFTASVRQLFLPLSQGATSIIATREQTKTPLSLFELIQTQGVTISDGVPSVWRYGLMALESLEQKYTRALSESKLRLIIFGGELLPYQLIKKLRNLFQTPPRFFNILGQTESIGNGFYPIPDDCNLEEGYVPVGNPLEKIQQVYVLNSQLEPVKIGESGELHIAGSTLARGYLNRTQANAEKFIDNPFEPQQRLFKTGDVARYSSNGSLEILGRIDFQVNIRGMRVELEEIESVLKLHPHVREGVVTLREDIPGDQRLTAYIVANNQTSNWGEIRSFLEQKLPDYMVPNAFVLMEKLPVLPNGKLDRNSLPAPNISADIRNFVAPRTPKEQVIANIWAEVLGLEKVGIYDNFLELGGHSLLASLVISRLREALSVELSVSVFFESLTVAILSEHIEDSYDHNQQNQTLPILESIDRSVELQLSLIQQRFWFLDQMEGANAAYNIARALRLVGRLNLTALQQAIESIIQRHETLRTSFGIVDEKPVQFIAATVPFTLPLVDLQELPEVEQLTELQRLITAEYTQPFDLSTAPLLRVKIICLESDSHVLLVTMHHIISDAWSVGIFLKELSGFYGVSPLPDLQIQYADYAYWQRQLQQNNIITTQLNYWKQQLADAPPVIELTTDRPRSAMQTFRGSIQRFKLGDDLTNKLKTLSQKSGTSLFMTLQAAFATLLYRYTGQEDIVIGSPITNRNRPALEPLIGFFVNTLVLRTRLENNPTFRELLAQVRQVALNAYAHQDVPFDQLVEVLQPQRHLSHSPLFQVMFVLQNSPVEKPKLPGLTVTQIELDRPTAGATFDLTLSMQEIDSELRGAFEYNANLFDAETIARMVKHFQTLVEAIVTNPDERVGQLPLLTAAEQHQLLVEWNNTQTDYPQNKCVHELVTEQAEKTPDAVALVFENQQLTYRQLNLQANQLAHYLQSLGVEKETLVGVFLERSFEMIVGFLGILKASGAYVPLDPNYPPERLNYMVADSQMSVILTHSSLLPHLSSTLEQAQTKIICWDQDIETITSQSLDDPINNVQPANLAYVIYTSGSTGQPKAVLIQHSALLNLVFWHLKNFEVKSSDRTTQLAGTAFDAAVWELWPYLVVGASIYLIKSEFLLSPKTLQEQLISQNITVSFIPTPLAEKLCVLAWSNNTALRIILTGGDRLNHYPSDTLPFKFFNNYGPTENTVVTTSGQILPGGLGSKFPPIGRPIANTQVYILDRYLQPVPIGVSGELYLGGVGLARGYLNRKDLTSERFIANPFVEDERLYKTGDLARFLPDGNIEFLGRIDHQVKIRGFRIELGEIETLLSQHPQVQQAVVIVREDDPGNKYLTAYIVSETETLTSSKLRQFLKEHLPEYMIPAAFVTLKALPLTPNGKVDRRVLPKPETTNSELEAAFVAPRTWLEEQLAEIWCTVLHREKVGIYDNFFELGGHSLLITSVISRIRESLSIAIPLHSLFAAPTIAALSQVITARQLEVQEQSKSGITFDTLQPLVPQLRDTYIPLSFAQESIWRLQQSDPESSAYNSFSVLRFTGSLSVSVLESSFNEIIRRHEILRTTFTVVEGQPVQIITPSLTIPLEIIDLQNLPQRERISEAQRLAALEYQRHFDLASVPLIKTTLLRLAPEEHWLIINIHHIITDGWSFSLLLEELRILYEAFANGLPSPLPELPVQYADFTLWQRKYFNENVIEQQLAYWLQKLTNTSLASDVVSSNQPQMSHSASASIYSVILPANLVASIEALSRSQRVSLFTIILTALKILLFKYTGKNEILVLVTVGNRSPVETEKMLGCFINDVILRSALLPKGDAKGERSSAECKAHAPRTLSHLSSEQTGITLLEEIKETLTEAINNKEIACETVIDAITSKQPLNISASLTMLPPQNWHDWSLDVDFVSIKRDLNLWDQEIPLEIYVSSPSVNNPTIEIKVLYSTELFTNETIEFLFSYYQEILQKLVQNPTSQVSEFAKDLSL
ncbi:amino acid adenylation enzyme/thioester reductase family protein [Cylindrospermum stagnale PCC 7417]|uniref:Amino acid adenylation enzyme/thioester reductase family protein n=1 Tax=Cylindrospermum stagnale PCC 7417 TaxID=56107 RepID=K9WUC8_9NOST|nr:non-ribosomal peptide synthetase [Cylindrospermum stagnale]AFZ23112.1 amino acid adenylation enzyme/thioester reductase family protein [Cylindrospermum stagnale PCC 7417]